MDQKHPIIEKLENILNNDREIINIILYFVG